MQAQVKFILQLGSHKYVERGADTRGPDVPIGKVFSSRREKPFLAVTFSQRDELPQL